MRKALLFLVLGLPLLCHAATTQLEIKADKLRNAAMSAFEKDHNQKKALQLNAAALRLTHHLPETSWRTIENYDDAGLYYYESSKWKASARHQAIAVLLACGMEESKAMFPLYVKRLGFAFSKYRPGEDFAPIVANPLLLLKDIPLNLRANADLRRRYFKTIRSKPGTQASAATYLYKIKPSALPATCYIQPDQAEEQAVKSE
ncbi:hypothetical protein ACO0LD_24120 [Undibacterium sp. Ji83W]|uniref:hypothetical protein n=1 Tax=Undibacterium sp. Ji83W TaxID=3413043 RepID=UPI003BF2ACF3